MGFKEEHYGYRFIQHNNKGKEKVKKYIAEHNYITHQDLLQKLGHKEYKPKLGGLGRALIEAANQGSIGWMKKQLDLMFKKVREEKRNKHRNEKQNSRDSLQPNA